MVGAVYVACAASACKAGRTGLICLKSSHGSSRLCDSSVLAQMVKRSAITWTRIAARSGIAHRRCYSSCMKGVIAFLERVK